MRRITEGESMAGFEEARLKQAAGDLTDNAEHGERLPPERHDGAPRRR